MKTIALDALRITVMNGYFYTTSTNIGKSVSFHKRKYTQIVFFPLVVAFPKKCYFYTVIINNLQAQELMNWNVSQDKVV